MFIYLSSLPSCLQCGHTVIISGFSTEAVRPTDPLPRRVLLVKSLRSPSCPTSCGVLAITGGVALGPTECFSTCPPAVRLVVG